LGVVLCAVLSSHLELILGKHSQWGRFVCPFFGHWSHLLASYHNNFHLHGDLQCTNILKGELGILRFEGEKGNHYLCHFIVEDTRTLSTTVYEVKPRCQAQ
jgi:hypothetical protein